MSTWGHVFLGVIAVSTLFTAIVQIVVLLAAARAARRIEKLTDTVEAQLQPLLAHLDTVGREAARAASLAAEQVERVDALFVEVTSRVESTMSAVQSTLAAPLREGSALLAALRAAFGGLKDRATTGPRGRQRGDDEDALFI